MSASAVGQLLEQYDFTLYGLAAALVFGKLFFPGASSLAGTAAAFATFGVGFVARPLGAAVCGHLGDRLGRRWVLLATLGTMGISTFLIGLLPTAGAIGVWAPVLLVLLRLVQGFSAGGEMGSAAIMAAEHARDERRGLIASIPGATGTLGALAGTAVFALSSAVSGGAFLSWGWRIPFLVGIVVAVVGLLLRANSTESPVFLGLKESGRIDRRPIATVFRVSTRGIVLGALIVTGFTAFGYTLFTFSATYLTSILGLSLNLSFVSLVGVYLGQGVATLGFAALSDRLGRRPVMLAGSVFMVCYAFALFPLLNTKSPIVIVAALTVAAASTGSIWGPGLAFLCEQFPSTVRNSGVSISYQVGSLLGGGVTPLVATALFSSWHTWIVISVYLAVLLLLTCGAVYIARETRDRRLDDASPATESDARSLLGEGVGNVAPRAGEA